LTPILIYRLGSLGDTVIALPCFHAVARAFPNRRRLVLTNVPVSSKAAPLEIILRGSGLIDGVIDYPVGTRSIAALWRLRRAIRATGADTLIYMTPPRGARSLRRDLLFFRLCGIRRIIGAPATPDLQVGQTADGAIEPEAERMARSLAALGPIDLTDRANWDMRLTQAERTAAAEALAPLGGTPFIAINMGGKVAINDWGEDNWRALADRLAPRHGALGLIAVGGNEDIARSQAVLARWPGPTANACGALTPRQSAAALTGATLFIGHDSGPLHLAAASGAPAIGLFGNNNPPRKWHPYGPACQAIHDMRGVRAITVDQVEALVNEAL
jgi:heptosyltransferase III